MTSILRANAKKVVAALIVLAMFGMARLPVTPDSEQRELASRFKFEKHELPGVPGKQFRNVRDVHPSLERISAWISSVGGAVALNDLDGDGLSNDVVYVETRSDQVIVAPVPTTGDRFEPFELISDDSAYKPGTTAPMGAIPADLNQDGLMDLLVYYWGRTPVAFLRIGDAPLSAAGFKSVELVEGAQRWFTNAATIADIDGDGMLDIVIGNYFNDGGNILDKDGTGIEEMQHSMSRAYNGGHNRILRCAAIGDNLRYEEFMFEEQIARGWTLALGACDLDGDLLPEIYFANDFGPDRLLHNRSKPGEIEFALLHGRKEWTTPNSQRIGVDSFKGMGVDFGDINGDGIPDIYVSNIAAPWMLLESHYMWVSVDDASAMKEGRAPYQNHSERLGLSRSGWGWETKLDDFDNDGALEAIQATGFVRGDKNRWPELQELATANDEFLPDPRFWFRCQPGDDISGYQHNPFFVRASSGRFVDLAKPIGIDEPMVTRGIATADVNGDGLLDFAVGNQWEASFLYLNKSEKAGRSLILNLRLPTSNGRSRSAVDATATVELPNGRKIARQVDGGNGHSGARSNELCFGLGDTNSEQITVTVKWRDANGKPQSQRLQLPPGRHEILLKEGDR